MNDTVKFRCQKCGVKIEADSSYKGNIAECPQCGNVIMIPAQGVGPGLLIDDFELEAPLGSGVLGEVWLANQISMKRPVAIKILSPAITADPKAMSHFFEDIKNIGKLNHPYIVPALKAGNKGQIYYLAYEYIKGQSIANIVAEGKPVAEPEILTYAESIAEALMYAWNKHELLHRDLSPDHVIIDSHGRPMILDMAISKTIAEDTSVTSTGLILGSPPFMSPEIVGGKKDIDCRADIFSLGAIIYSMATASIPYDNLPPAKLFMMQLKETFPKVKDKNPKASERLVRLVEIMTARKKTYRQHSWEDVIFDIRQVRDGKMPATPQPPSLSSNVTDKFESTPKIKCAAVHPKRAKFGKDSKTRLLQIYRKSPRKQSSLYLGILILVILVTASSVLYLHYSSYLEENQRIEREHRALEKLLELTAKRKDNILHKKGDARLSEARKLFRTSTQQATALIKKGAYDNAINLLEKARIEELLLLGHRNNTYLEQLEKDIYKYKMDRDQKLEELTTQFEEKVESLNSQGKYAEAAALLEKYSGPLKEESAELRSILAIKYKTKAQFQEQEKAEASKPVVKEKKTVFDPQEKPRQFRLAAELLFKGALNEAIAALKKIKDQDAANLIKTIENVRDRNKILGQSFLADKDKKVLLLVNDENKELTVKDVKGEKLFLEEEIENGVKLVFPVSFKDIELDEKINRISKQDPAAAELYKGIIEAKRNNYEEALEAFSKTGAISPFLKEVVDFEKSKYHENEQL